jgi:cytoplasmic iron level regulating protein YaaA (DUF328/UPF0246 family)
MNDFIILIPPSEGKTPGGNNSALRRVSKEVQAVIDQWKNVPESQWGKLLGVKGKVLQRAVKANCEILTSATMPAIKRYSGVVYNAIDYDTLDKSAKKFFNQHIRIVSAVFGLVKPQDKIPDYKCKINNFKLDQYWRPIHSKALKDVEVIDLLPGAHQKAVGYLHGRKISFSVIKNNKKVSAGHHGKHIKGRFIRWLCQQRSTSQATLKKFNEDGYVWHNGEYCQKR